MPGMDFIVLIMDGFQAVRLPGHSGPSEAAEKPLWGISFPLTTQNLKTSVSCLVHEELVSLPRMILSNNYRKSSPGWRLCFVIYTFSPIFTTNSSPWYHPSRRADWDTERKPWGTCPADTVHRFLIPEIKLYSAWWQTLDTSQYLSQNPKDWMSFTVDIPNYIILFPAK